MMNESDKKDGSINANGTTKKKILFKRGKTFCKQED
jgi:hypothetical protein